MRAPGYNSPQRMTFSNRLLPWIIALLCIPSAHALNSWDSPSANFARQIAALAGPGTITLTFTNRSNLSNDDVAAVRSAVEAGLRAAGLSVRAGNADCDIHVTLSQNAQGWLWVAEVQEGSERKVTMLSVASLSPVTGAGTAAPAITVRANLIYAQADPILDVAVLGAGNDQHLIVLEPEHIKAYSSVTGTWQLTQSYQIAHAQPFPRDLRGRIVLTADHLFDAYLPGVVCSAAKGGEAWSMTVACNDSDDPWPLESQKAFYNSTRDFFTGVLTPGFGPKLPPFYSATEVAYAGGTAFVFGDVSGAVHIVEGNSHKMLLGARDWGSDFTSVRSGCGRGTQVLTAAAGWPASDSIRAYETSGREAIPVSAPFAFDGMITAVWAPADRASATVVVRKPQESRYEAYSVSLLCSR